MFGLPIGQKPVFVLNQRAEVIAIKNIVYSFEMVF